MISTNISLPYNSIVTSVGKSITFFYSGSNLNSYESYYSMLPFELNFRSISDRKFSLCNQGQEGVKFHHRIKTLFKCKVLLALIVFTRGWNFNSCHY